MLDEMMDSTASTITGDTERNSYFYPYSCEFGMGLDMDMDVEFTVAFDVALTGGGMCRWLI